MDQTNHSRLNHSCCTTPAALCYWACAFALLYGGALLARAAWPPLEPYGATMLLAAIGGACVVNFRHNRTLHCAITGPLFLAAAVVAAFTETGAWRLDLSILWGIVLVGSAIAFLIEWRTVGRVHP